MEEGSQTLTKQKPQAPFGSTTQSALVPTPKKRRAQSKKEVILKPSPTILMIDAKIRDRTAKEEKQNDIYSLKIDSEESSHKSKSPE